MVNDKFPYFLKFRSSEKIVTATFAKIKKKKKPQDFLQLYGKYHNLLRLIWIQNQHCL